MDCDTDCGGMVERLFHGVGLANESVFKYDKVKLVLGVGVEGDGCERVVCTVSCDMGNEITASLDVVAGDYEPP